MALMDDPTLYRGSARFYRNGRLPYAPGMADALARALGLDGRGRLIDVGCGPGVVALELASMFERVVGIDADADMIAEADAEARRREITNVRWMTLRAEQLPAGLGRFRVATFAQSFHWTDRERVAPILRSMLGVSGAFVLVSAHTRQDVDPVDPMPHPRPPWEAITEVIRSYLGSETRAEQGLRDVDRGDPAEILSDWFTGPVELAVPDGRVLTRTANQVIAAIYSVSSSTPHLFGNQLDAFEAEVRGLLQEASPAGLFSVQTGGTGLSIWRPRS